jgi:hypothetical protein
MTEISYKFDTHDITEISYKLDTHDSTEISYPMYMIFQLYHGSQVYWRKKTTDGE